MRCNGNIATTVIVMLSYDFAADRLTYEFSCITLRGIVSVTLSRRLEARTMSKDTDREAKVKSLQQRGTLNRRPERVRNELFADAEFFDPEDLMQVKYEMLRAAERDGRSVSQAAQEFGLSRPAFYHAKRDFEKQGLAGLVPRKRGPKSPYKLTPPILSFIERIADSGETVSAQQLCEMIETEFDTRLHLRTVQRTLRRLEKGGRRR